jgi:uncharacterized membrane protein YphA (DoxX/SURF4 family)
MSEIQTPSVSKKMQWAGRIVSALPVLGLIFSGIMKFTNAEDLVKEFTRLGWSAGLAPALGITELACTALYVIPRTSVLGAILLTGYLGGATATHVRISDPFVAPIVMGVLVWLGLYLRDPRLRALIPLRS